MRNSLNITALQKLRATKREHAVSVSGYKSKVCILHSEFSGHLAADDKPRSGAVCSDEESMDAELADERPCGNSVRRQSY